MSESLIAELRAAKRRFDAFDPHVWSYGLAAVSNGLALLAARAADALQTLLDAKQAAEARAEKAEGETRGYRASNRDHRASLQKAVAALSAAQAEIEVLRKALDTTSEILSEMTRYGHITTDAESQGYKEYFVPVSVFEAIARGRLARESKPEPAPTESQEPPK